MVTKVSDEKLVELFIKGLSSGSISKVLKEEGVTISHQAIDIRRRKLVRDGKLQWTPKKRGKPGKQPQTQTSPTRKEDFSLDKGVVALVNMAGLASQVPSLKEELWQLKNKLAATENELKILRDDKRKKQEQNLQWRRALQHEEVNPPLS